MAFVAMRLLDGETADSIMPIEITYGGTGDDSLDFAHPWLVDRSAEQPYLTRLSTYIDPEEMTADPVFTFDGSLPDVSNVRDATGLEGLYGCERDGDGGGIIESIFGGSSDAIDPRDGGAQVVAFTPGADAATEGSAQEDAATSASGSGNDSVESAQDESEDTSTDDDEESSGWIVWFSVAVAFFGAGVAFSQLRKPKD